MRADNGTVFTIGHSTHSIARFLELLQTKDVTVVADVRSAPFSSFNPQFNKGDIARALKAHRIKYLYLGRELGARSDDPSCYENGRVQYSRLALTSVFRSGLERVRQGAREHRIALMCAEKEPLECHRAILVAPALTACGVTVEHIMPDGRVESHGAAMQRLLHTVGVPHQDLFRTTAQLIAEALARQEERVAYVNKKLAAESAADAK